MANKNKLIEKLTVKNINKVFGIIAFVLVFLFTFLFTATDPSLSSAKGKMITLIVFGSVLGFVILCWVGLIIFSVQYKKSKDTNQQNIKKALDKLEEKAKEAQEDK